LGDDTKRTNPLTEAMREDPLGRAKRQLIELRAHLPQPGLSSTSVPLTRKDPEKPGRDWMPEPEWISGWRAFEILALQSEPYEYAPTIARICQIISDQWDREDAGLNYAVSELPPSHDLLEDFTVGSPHWFRALYLLLKVKGAEAIEGWEKFVSDLYDWVGPFDCLRLHPHYLLENALGHDWSVYELSLPEAKQEPIWSFPWAMAWIATRDYLALARIGNFRSATGEDEPLATDGICKYNTRALGWLHCEIAYTHCKCGALQQFGGEAFKHCTCISIAWEELVRFRGGLSQDIPELVFNLQEHWISMTWPEGAEEIRFLRRDILDRWPAPPVIQPEMPPLTQSTTTAEHECREWLVKAFAADPDRRRSKKDFREAALAAFPGRLSERGFNLRVWPELSRDHGRDGAGAKRKS
jgi:hypothetical protein